MCDIDKKWYFLDIFWDFIDNDILLSVLLCWYLKDYRGQLTPVFFIFFILCVRGQFTAVIEMNLFQQVLWAFLPLSHFFSKSVHHLWVKFLHLGCYQVNEISINRIHLCNAEKTEVASEVAFRCIYTLFNAALRTWNALTCSYKCINNVLIF